MITYNTIKYGRWLLGIYLMMFTITSCSYDYFEDENNFRVYVPQIERGEIERFYIAFHDKAAKHTITRQIESPFTKDELMKQGILRFKLPYGEYSISCFADYTPGSITEGNQLTDSYKKQDQIEGDTYRSSTSNPRSLFTSAVVYPIGHPDAAILRTIDIDKNQCYKGKVISRFEKLPSQVARIDIYYKGLSTKYGFDSTFDRFSPNDCIYASFDVGTNTQGIITECQNRVDPSVNSTFGRSAPISKALGNISAAPMELEIKLFDASNNIVGILPFTVDDFEYFKVNNPSQVPVDEHGNPIEKLVLNPQSTIILTFKGFTIVSIQLYGWGDIIEGGSTPM